MIFLPFSRTVSGEFKKHSGKFGTLKNEVEAPAFGSCSHISDTSRFTKHPIMFILNLIKTGKFSISKLYGFVSLYHLYKPFGHFFFSSKSSVFLFTLQLQYIVKQTVDENDVRQLRVIVLMDHRILTTNIERSVLNSLRRIDTLSLGLNAGGNWQDALTRWKKHYN